MDTSLAPIRAALSSLVLRDISPGFGCDAAAGIPNVPVRSLSATCRTVRVPYLRDARIAANVPLVGVDSHGGMATLATRVQRDHEVGPGVVSAPSAVRLWPADQTS